MTRIFIVAAAALVLAAAAPAASAARLTGTVGTGFTITMSARSVKAGAYIITIRDRSAIHNFHLVGPGVDDRTSVDGVKTSTWKIALKHGTYRFRCDVHSSIMHGVLHVT